MRTHPIEQARRSAGLSQRRLAEQTGIPQATLSRIITGDRAAKLPELMVVSTVTGWSLEALTGASPVADRAECAARVPNGAAGDELRNTLVHFLELNAYLEDQAIT